MKITRHFSNNENRTTHELQTEYEDHPLVSMGRDVRALERQKSVDRNSD
jgi:hypothetical protein